MLTGIDPVAVNHWFLAGYIDAYDWVMWPNVSGMGLNADGGREILERFFIHSYLKD
jgi:deoxyribodipyrimidine photolyase-related protein